MVAFRKPNPAGNLISVDGKFVSVADRGLGNIPTTSFIHNPELYCIAHH